MSPNTDTIRSAAAEAATALLEGLPATAGACLRPEPGPYLLLDATARDGLGGPAAEPAIEHALDLAEPDLVLFPVLTHLSRRFPSATSGTAPSRRPTGR
jgi:hypothetical protein